MVRNARKLLFIGLALVALLFTTTMSQAQAPVPPVPPPPVGNDVPLPDKETPTSDASPARTLAAMTTPEQDQAIRTILQNHAAELAAIRPNLPPTPEWKYDREIGTVDISGANVNMASIQANLDASTQVATVQDAINQEIAAVLTPEQKAIFDQIVLPAKASLQRITDKVALLSSMSTGTTPQYISEYLLYAGMYTAYADYNLWESNLMAYYQYEENSSYYCYDYMYYSWAYVSGALQNIGIGFFDIYTNGVDSYSTAESFFEYLVYSYEYGYDGAVQCYNDYTNYGSEYAYYAAYYAAIGIDAVTYAYTYGDYGYNY